MPALRRRYQNSGSPSNPTTPTDNIHEPEMRTAVDMPALRRRYQNSGSPSNPTTPTNNVHEP
ncbi:hypothetical protein HAV15_003403 [Penicillium sp. str. |nr:hypothetical protein HAV15_003403 [Penicillium sp. str. \